MTCPTPRLVAAALALLGAAASAQEIPAPTFVVGDSWSFRETDLLTRTKPARSSRPWSRSMPPST
jgi:hypothetical protein